MPSKPVVFIVGADKGGVGKTVTSRALLDFFKSQGVETRAYDTEPGDGVLKKFHPETEMVDLTRSDGQMKVFDNISDQYVSLIDCKAGLLSETLQTLSDIGFMAAVAEGKIEVVVLHVMGATKASFDEIKAAASKLAGARHYLVTNHINDTEYFGWDSAEAKAVLASVTGVIDLPKLDELAMEHVGSALTSFSNFRANLKNSFVIRGKIGNWLGKVFEGFNRAKLDPKQWL